MYRGTDGSNCQTSCTSNFKSRVLAVVPANISRRPAPGVADCAGRSAAAAVRAAPAVQAAAAPFSVHDEHQLQGARAAYLRAGHRRDQLHAWALLHASKRRCSSALPQPRCSSLIAKGRLLCSCFTTRRPTLKRILTSSFACSPGRRNRIRQTLYPRKVGQERALVCLGSRQRESIPVFGASGGKKWLV